MKKRRSHSLSIHVGSVGFLLWILDRGVLYMYLCVCGGSVGIAAMYVQELFH